MELVTVVSAICYLSYKVLIDLVHRFSCWFIEED